MGRPRSGVGRLVLPFIALYSWVERRRAVYYLDTSTLVKRYVHEQGSLWIGTLADALGHDLYMIRHVLMED